MTRDHAISVLSGLRATLEDRGVLHLGLFGSIARGEARENSDIDIVVQMSPARRIRLFDLGAVQTVLEQAFSGRPVDVVLEPVREPALADAIRRDRADVF